MQPESSRGDKPLGDQKPTEMQELEALSYQTKLCAKKFKILQEQTADLVPKMDDSLSLSLTAMQGLSPTSFSPTSSGSFDSNVRENMMRSNPGYTALNIQRAKAFLSGLHLLREYEVVAGALQVLYHRPATSPNTPSTSISLSMTSSTILAFTSSESLREKVSQKYKVVQHDSTRLFFLMLALWRAQHGFGTHDHVSLPKGRCVLCLSEQKSYCLACEKKMERAKLMTTLYLYGLNLLNERNINASPAVQNLLEQTIRYVRGDNAVFLQRERTQELAKARDDLTKKLAEKRARLETVRARKEAQQKRNAIKREAMEANEASMLEMQNANFNVLQSISKMEAKLNRLKKQKLLELKEVMNIAPVLYTMDSKYRYLARFNLVCSSDFFEQSPELGAAVLGEIVLLLFLIAKYLEIPDLPYPIQFCGSYSTIFNPLANRQTVLNRELCKDIEEFRTAVKNLNQNMLHISSCSGLEISRHLLVEQLDFKLGTRYLISNLFSIFTGTIKKLEQKIGKSSSHYRFLSSTTSNEMDLRSDESGRMECTDDDDERLPELPRRLPPSIFAPRNPSVSLTAPHVSPPPHANNSMPRWSPSGSPIVSTTPSPSMQSLSSSPNPTPNQSPSLPRQIPPHVPSSATLPSTANLLRAHNTNNHPAPVKKDNSDEYEGFLLLDDSDEDSAVGEIINFIPKK